MSKVSDELMAAALRAKSEENFKIASECLVKAIAALRQEGSALELADALRSLGEVQRAIVESDGGVAAYREAVAILREHDAPLKLAHAVRHLGDIYRHAGAYRESAECYDEALSLYREHPEASELDHANALRGAALLKERTGERPQAIALWQHARELYIKTDIAVAIAESSRRIERLSRELQAEE